MRDVGTPEKMPESFGIAGNTVFADGDECSDVQIAHRRSRDFCRTVLMDALEWDLTEGRVISIYGIGGEGKSYFVQDVYDHATAAVMAYEDKRVPADRAKVRRIYIDFFDENATRLSRLRKVFDAFKAQGVFCHSFCIAYHSYFHPKGEDLIAAGYLDDLNSCPDSANDDFFSFATDSALGLANTALEVAATAFNPFGSVRDLIEIAWDARDRRERAKAESEAKGLLHSYANYEGRSLLDRMPDLMLSDLEGYVETHPGERLLVIVDSFEHLCSKDLANVLGVTGQFVQRLTHLPSTLWVIAGRLALRGEGWNNVVRYPIELVGLGPNETGRILAKNGIEGPDAVAHVQEITGGIPVFVDLCIDHLKRAGDDVPHRLERLVADVKDCDSLLDHYLDGMDDNLRKSVFVMAYLREWNEDLLWDVLEDCVDKDDAGAIVEGVEAGGLPFVSARGNTYQIHEVVGAMLRGVVPSNRATRNFFVSLFRCLREKTDRLKADERDAQSEHWHERMLLLTRALYDLGMHVESFVRTYRRSLSIDDIRVARMDHVKELKWAKLYLEARDALVDALDAHGNAWDTYGMELRLELAAVLSLIYVRTDDEGPHRRALKMEEAVLLHLEQTPHPDEGLLMRARNSLGVSHYRLAKDCDEIQLSVSYHMLNYERVNAKPCAEVSEFETKCLNNYGVSCLKAAALVASDEDKSIWLRRAGEAFERAARVRKVILGAEADGALVSLTNRGISLYRLAELECSEELFAESDSCLREVLRCLDRVSYPAGSDRRLYNAFHRALLEEAWARASEKSGDIESAALHMREALRRHGDVKDARERFGADKMDCRKSADSVSRCELCLNNYNARLEQPE